MPQPVANGLRTRHKAAERSDRFTESSDPNGDSILNAQVLAHAAAIRSKHASPVSLVDDNARVESLREITQLDQRRHVAVHAEHGVGHDPPPAFA